jgi:hypothetical protein
MSPWVHRRFLDEDEMTLPDGRLHPTERDLLDQLGDLDPAASQFDALEAWENLVHVSGELIRGRPSPDEWSALEVLAHLTAVELTNGLRYRAMLVEDSPVLTDYEVADWAPLLRRADIDVGSLLALFRALRLANLDFWEHLDATGRGRIGIHPECGPESIELRFRMMAGHDRMHLAQARQALKAVWAGR